MDYADQNQLDQQQGSNRLMSESTSLEQAQMAVKHSGRVFEESTATDKQVKDEMQFTMMNCSPCVRGDA